MFFESKYIVTWGRLKFDRQQFLHFSKKKKNWLCKTQKKKTKRSQHGLFCFVLFLDLSGEEKGHSELLHDCIDAPPRVFMALHIKVVNTWSVVIALMLLDVASSGKLSHEVRNDELLCLSWIQSIS